MASTRVVYTPPKFNSSPLKSCRNPIGKDRLPTTIFQGRAVKLWWCIPNVQAFFQPSSHYLSVFFGWFNGWPWSFKINSQCLKVHVSREHVEGGWEI